MLYCFRRMLDATKVLSKCLFPALCNMPMVASSAFALYRCINKKTGIFPFEYRALVASNAFFACSLEICRDNKILTKTFFLYLLVYTGKIHRLCYINTYLT